MIDYASIPSPFYRISVKALVYDDQNKILIVKHQDGKWEMPGGGLEYDESIAECLKREFQEELGVSLEVISEDAICMYRGSNQRGYMACKFIFPASLSTHDFIFTDDIVEATFVDKAELLKLPMNPDEVGIKQYVDRIWPD